MATKLKSSKAYSFLLAAGAVTAAVAVFLAFYPAFGEQAANYYTDSLRGEELLGSFYRSNLVLYKSLLDKAGGEEVKYSGLYLEIEREEMAWEEQKNAQYIISRGEETPESLTEKLVKDMERLMGNWKEETINGLSKTMDYCAIDHGSGEILKNTGRKIEKLYEDKSLSQEEAPYVYYVMMTYGKAGNMPEISVRDEKPDELLKNVQAVMAGEWLRDTFMEYMDYSYSEVYYFENGEKINLGLIDKPRDCTFIYALTQEQKEQMKALWNKNNAFARTYWIEMKRAYLEAGIVRAYLFILAALALIALAITRDKRYCLHRLGICRLYLEAGLVALGFYLGALGDCPPVVGLVCYTHSGFFPEVFKKYLSFVPAICYPALAILVNMVALYLLFGFWYYLATTWGEVFDMGPVAFLKERSLCIKLVMGAGRWLKRKREELKYQFLHVDLGGKAEKAIIKIVFINFTLLAAISAMWVFGWAALAVYTVLLYFLLKKYVKKIQEQYQKLFAATRSIADGNLQTRFEEDWGVFESYKEELSRIQNGFKAAVDKEVKSQKMKTELITNVSHDLKTPLTAITTYIELLEDENLSPEKRREYLGVLKKKSERLNFLIEDLFEVSKTTSGNISLNPVDVDICNLMRQVYLEYEDQVEEAGLVFRFRLPEEKVVLKLDSQKTYRVFENLYLNIIKYAMPHTRVYVNGEKTETGIDIELKNMSAAELNVAPEDLTERFVRGDSARNTEGSGLGLAIARNFVELQGGGLHIEIDGDLFKVRVCW